MVRHAGLARAEVAVRFEPGTVAVEALDDGHGHGPGAGAAAGGHGLLGMRERVAVWGGTLQAGPRPGGGFRVAALDGITATRRITTDPATASTRVLILTTFDNDEHVFAALRAGASGFLPKDTAPDALLDAARRPASRRRWKAEHAGWRRGATVEP